MSSFELDDFPRHSKTSRLKYGLAMDATLVLLGGSTVWLATQNLSFEDSRPLYNAGTYVVGIPAGLVLVDVVFRTIVSRFVERALQVAFLLSMLVHLLMTLGAIRTMLFADGSNEQTQKAVSLASKPEKVSSVPEYIPKFEESKIEKPDYLRPAKTDSAKATQTDPDKEAVELPANLPALAKIPDTTIETPEPNITIAKDEWKDPDIRSSVAKLERPKLAPAMDDLPSSVEVPKSQPLQEAEKPEPPEIQPKALSFEKQSNEPSSSGLSLDRLEPISTAEKSRLRSPSKSPERLERRDFELPAIENRKTELSRRDLSSDSASRVPTPSMSRVPLMDLPKSIAGDVAYQLPSTTINQPSEFGDKSPSIGLRQNTQSVGGSVSRAALEGVAEAGILANQSASQGLRSSTPAMSRQSAGTEEIAIDGAKAELRNPKGVRRDVGTKSSKAIPIPERAGGASASGSDEESITGLHPSSADSKKRTASASSLAGSGETLRGLSLGVNEFQPSINIGRPVQGTIASAANKRSKLEDSLPSIDLLGLPGAKQLPRLPSTTPTPNAPAVPIPVPAFQQRMARNDGSSDVAELGELGPATEAAIERGLEFLAKHQRSDGSWHLEDFGDLPRLRSHTAATALSLLAFQGAGYSHRQYHYAPVCKSALEFLLANQQSNGDLYIPMDETSNANARFYSHSIASLALCEAFGMTQDESLREPAQRAVEFMLKTQDPVGGGWRYQPGIESDTSVSGWYMMALKSAELSGLKVPKTTFDRIRGWLDRAQASPQERHLYRYNPLATDSPVTRHGRIPNPTMTGVGLLMRLYLGWRRDTSEMARGADYLLQHLPAEGTSLDPKRDTYYWYYATQVMFHMGGERWKRWNGALYPLLIRSQQLEGEQHGSWNPAGPVPDRWGPFAGRLYVTTLNLLSLEVYYRHLPIYEDSAR